MTTQKVSAPVVGFNHNLKHGGRIYHVQTEDSGLPRAHFITHLYIGGNILGSMKGSYSDIVEEPEMLAMVRKRMEEQHKQMVRRLVAGEFAETAAKFSPHYEPGVLASGHTGPAAVNTAHAEPTEAGAAAGGPAVPPAPLPPPAAPMIGVPMIGIQKVGMQINLPAAAAAHASHPTGRAHQPVAPAAKPAARPGSAAPRAPAQPAHSSGPAAHAPPSAQAKATAQPQRPPAAAAYAAPPAQAAPTIAHAISADDEEPFVSFDTQPDVPMLHLEPPTSSPPPAPARLPGAPLPSTTRLSPTSHRPNAPPRMAPVIAPTPPPAIKPPPVSNHPSSPKHASPGRPAPPRPPPGPRPPPQPSPPAISPSIFAAEDRPAALPNDDLPILFAEELISERSLDEVILAFLSSGSDSENPPK